MNSFHLDWQGCLRKVTSLKRKDKIKYKKKKEVTPPEALEILGSVIIILMALGGLGLVLNIFL